MTLKRYAILPNGLKGKFRKIWGLIPTFVKVRGVKLVGRGGGGGFFPHSPYRIGLKMYVTCEGASCGTSQYYNFSIFLNIDVKRIFLYAELLEGLCIKSNLCHIRFRSYIYKNSGKVIRMTSFHQKMHYIFKTKFFTTKLFCD